MGWGGGGGVTAGPPRAQASSAQYAPNAPVIYNMSDMSAWLGVALDGGRNATFAALLAAAGASSGNDDAPPTAVCGRPEFAFAYSQS